MSKECEQSIMLIKCKHCGQIYKVVDTKYNANTSSVQFVTDFGDLLPVNLEKNSNKCLKCGEEIVIKLGKTIMFTEDWVADKVFTIKG